MKTPSITITILAFLATPVLASETRNEMKCAKVDVVDGDTLRCDGQLLRMLGDGSPNKEGFDTPELRSYECRAEAMLARLARLRLVEILDTNEYLIEDFGVVDDFDRPLVKVWLESSRTAGGQLMDEGYAVRWTPNHEKNWCGK